MSLTFLFPHLLWLLMLIPVTASIALAGPRRPTFARFWGRLILRSLLLLIIILALAGVQLRLPDDADYRLCARSVGQHCRRRTEPRPSVDSPGGGGHARGRPRRHCGLWPGCAGGAVG
ncbi:MAG: hypothetical protein R2911_13605 [Caldilineaceae bacterium]